MADFLDEMDAGSRSRWKAAEATESFEAVRARALATPAPPALVLDGRFDLIAEVKLAAPSSGRLREPPADPPAFAAAQARRYADAGAVAISCLTEPSRFDGSLANLAAAVAAVDVPVMRKDFLVAPYQVWEGRAEGAGGVLLIARMLDDATLDAMGRAATEAGIFVLLEAFDEVDLARSAAFAARWPADAPPLLVGINTRNLATLQVVPGRLRELVGLLPDGVPWVAESGLRTPDDVREVAGLGYTLGLVGSALMQAEDTRALAAGMLAAGRG